MPTVKRRPKRTRGETTLGNVAAAAKRADENQGGNRWLKLEDGEVVTCRVVDVGADFKDAYVHRVPMTTEDDDGNAKHYHADVPCLDQKEKGVPCPGCKKDIPRRYKFWCNVIVRDHEDDDGKTEDRIMILSGGINLARKLGKMDAKHGLINRDIEIEREGVKKKTKYDADWADDENVPLSAADEKLVERKHKIDKYAEPPDFDDFFKAPRDRAKDDDDDDTGTAARSRNVLKRERNTDSDDDDDDEPKPRRTVKKSSTTTRKSNPLSPNGAGKSKTVVRRRITR